MSKGLKTRSFTPALAHSFLTPVYDLSVRLFTRERRWRNRLIELTNPEPNDRVLDIGCGTGTQAIWFKKQFPSCDIVGIDPDEKSLAIAKKKSIRNKLDVQWVQGFVDSSTVQSLGKFSRIVSSLVLHQTSVKSKREIMESAMQMLVPSGRFCIADYGVQSTWAMKMLYRLIVQNIDGYHDTQPNADGFLTECLGKVGFATVRHEGEIHTLTGSISLIVAEPVKRAS